MQEVQIRNQQLTEQLEVMEKVVAQKAQMTAEVCYKIKMGFGFLLYGYTSVYKDYQHLCLHVCFTEQQSLYKMGSTHKEKKFSLGRNSFQ